MTPLERSAMWSARRAALLDVFPLLLPAFGILLVAFVLIFDHGGHQTPPAQPPAQASDVSNWPVG